MSACSFAFATVVTIVSLVVEAVQFPSSSEVPVAKWSPIDCVTKGSKSKADDAFEQLVEQFESTSLEVLSIALSTQADQRNVNDASEYAGSLKQALQDCKTPNIDALTSRVDIFVALLMNATHHRNNLESGVDPTGFAYSLVKNHLDLPSGSTTPWELVDWSMGKVASLDFQVTNAIEGNEVEDAFRNAQNVNAILGDANEQLKKSIGRTSPEDPLEPERDEAVMRALQSHVQYLRDKMKKYQ